MFEVFFDVAFLFFLGILGWVILSLIHIPTPSLIGPIVIIGGLRALGYELPISPGPLALVVQTTLGVFIGVKITRETIRGIKSIHKPALLITVWTLSIVFIMGGFLFRVTDLDLYTALLSSSMGGLPEMTVLALSTNAELSIVIVMQLFRMIVTTALAPMILKQHIRRECTPGETSMGETSVTKERISFRRVIDNYTNAFKLYNKDSKNFFSMVVPWTIYLLIGYIGGYTFLGLSIPAGGMVGSMVFIATASLIGLPVKSPSSFAFQVLLVGVGVTVSDNISIEAFEVLSSGKVLLPLILSTIIVFTTSYGVALVIQKQTGWDFPTSFLAAAPAGIAVMSTLAMKYDKDPFSISMLHLCRLMAIKIVVPLVFMLWF